MTLEELVEELQDRKKAVPAVLFGLCAVIVITLSLCDAKERDYIVFGKSDKKIAYRDISNPHNIHVMTFDADTGRMAPGFYPYINIGDTITGAAHAMDAPFVSSQIIGGRPPVHTYAIRRLNGKQLREIQQIACRDSILRTMNQKSR